MIIARVLKNTSIHKRICFIRRKYKAKILYPLQSSGQIVKSIVYSIHYTLWKRQLLAMKYPLKYISLPVLISAMLFIAVPCFGADKKENAADKAQQKLKKDLRQIIFEEQKIEGKIRRPQLVLIKADQRPAFSPMVLQSFGKNENIAEFVDQSAIENMPNQNAFQFSGTKVSNFIP